MKRHMKLSEYLNDKSLPQKLKDKIIKISEREDIPDDILEDYCETLVREKSLRHKLEEQIETNQNLLKELHNRERREKKLKSRLIYHRITGLGNHDLLDSQLVSIIKEANSSPVKRYVIVYLIALDDSYDMIKKTLPPSIVEWVLYQTADRLRNILSGNAQIYHTRENEFAVVLVNAEKSRGPLDFAQKIIKTVSEQFNFPGYKVSLNCNVGFAIYPDHGMTKGLLLRNADIALSLAKKDGKHFYMYSRRMSVEVIEKMELQNSILKALEEQAILEINKQFELVYQPIVQVNSLEKGVINYQVDGSEALIRWNHPLKGKIAPSKFIPLAEESGLIIPIGTWVLFSAADQLNNWEQEGLSDLYIAVNLSPRQFKDPNLIENIERVLVKRNIDPGNIVIEITEGSVMEEPDRAIEKLKIIRDIGIRISVDDFGTGYSSLSYLRTFEIDTVKIAKSFIDDLSVNSSNKGIVKAIIALANSLDIDVLAEGVESYQQAEILFSLGCRKFQGFFFGKPAKGFTFVKNFNHRSKLDTIKI
jgi:diguanylate cyclase